MTEIRTRVAMFADAVMRGQQANPLLDLAASLAHRPIEDWIGSSVELVERGWPMAAIALLAEAEQKFGAGALLDFHRALAYRQVGDWDRSDACARAAIARQPHWPEPVWFLADGLRERGRTHAAASLLRDFVAQAPVLTDAETVCACLQFISECGEWDAVYALGQVALRGLPGSIRLRELLAKSALLLGRFEDARGRYRELIADAPEPARSMAALGLALSARFADPDDGDVARIDALLLNPGPEHAHANIHFARAKISDDLKEYARAAAHLRSANAIACRIQPWAREQWGRDYARALQATLPRNRAAMNERRPVFVIGLPRSGTTLLAERMARHAGIVTRGELNFAEHLDRAVSGAEPAALDHAMQSTADIYLAHLVRDDAVAQFYIDKNPMNFLHMDWIVAAFPAAHVIYCTRNMADVALSLWFQNFESPATRFSHAFDWIEEVAAGCEEIVRRWSQRAEILCVAYEDLVQHEATVMARVLHHIGYQAPSDHGHMQQMTAAIATSSVWQARQPVYSSSIGRHLQYLEHIPDLRRFL